MNPAYQDAVHHLLTEACNHLGQCPDNAPGLYDLLTRLVTDLADRDQLGTFPPSLGCTVDHAAAWLLNHPAAQPQPVATPFDHNLPSRLNELDRLPLPDRLRLLQAAARDAHR